MAAFYIRTKARFIGIDKSNNEVTLGISPCLLEIPPDIDIFSIVLFSEIDRLDAGIYSLLGFIRGKIREIELYSINIGIKELEFISECRPARLIMINVNFNLDARRQFTLENTIYVKISGVKHLCFLSLISFPHLEVVSFGEGVDLSSLDCSAFQHINTMSVLGSSVPKNFVSFARGVSLSEKTIREVNLKNQFPFVEDLSLLYSQNLIQRAPLLISELEYLFFGCHGISSIVFSRFSFIPSMGNQFEIYAKSNLVIFNDCEIRSFGYLCNLTSIKYSFNFCDLNCCDFSSVIDGEANFFSSMIDRYSICSAIRSFRDVKFVKCGINDIEL